MSPNIIKFFLFSISYTYIRKFILILPQFRLPSENHLSKFFPLNFAFEYFQVISYWINFRELSRGLFEYFFQPNWDLIVVKKKLRIACFCISMHYPINDFVFVQNFKKMCDLDCYYLIRKRTCILFLNISI